MYHAYSFDAIVVYCLERCKSVKIYKNVVISITQVGGYTKGIAGASSAQPIQSEMNRVLFLYLNSGISRLKTLC